MGEPQYLAVTLENAVVGGLVDRPPGLLVVICRADEPLARVGGSSDQAAHPLYLRRQLAYAAPHQITEVVGDRDWLVGQGHVRMTSERAGAFERVERVSAARFIEPGQGVPRQHNPQL